MSSESLRERRRRQTSTDIHDAAVRLVRLRGGVDRVTVEEISAAAGVSPRTFFNYFSSKESAIAFAQIEISAELAAEFVAAGPAPHPVLLGDVIEMTIRNLPNIPRRREEMADLLAIAHSSAAVTSVMLSRFDRFQECLAALVAQRAGMQPGDEVPVLIAALAMAVVRTAMVRWVSESPKDAHDTPVPQMRHAATLVQSLFTGVTV